MEQNLAQKLKQLEDLILQERRFACTMQIDGLKQLQEEKGLLVKEIRALDGQCSSEQKQIAGRLREENRRNAQLLFTCLNYLRQAMHNCTKQLTPTSYGRRGNSLQSTPSGLLLTGRM
jgi:flagellar biosynthesis/type III secretory pathway chaperone